MESFLTVDIIFESPNISRLVEGKTTNRIEGREETMEYLKLLEKSFPSFVFDNALTEVIKEDRMVVMKGIMQHNKKPLAANYLVNEYGKFQHISVSYPEGFE